MNVLFHCFHHYINEKEKTSTNLASRLAASMFSESMIMQLLYWDRVGKSCAFTICSSLVWKVVHFILYLLNMLFVCMFEKMYLFKFSFYFLSTSLTWLAQIFPAVLRALKNRVSRLALTQELSLHIHANRAMLEHQQFDLIVKLLNCALQVVIHTKKKKIVIFFANMRMGWVCALSA